MKIETHRNRAYHTIPADMKKQSDLQAVPYNVSKNYDTVTIQAPKDLSPSQSFRTLLTSKISAEVRATTPTQKLETIKQQIENNTYEIDPDKIVAGIMLLH